MLRSSVFAIIGLVLTCTLSNAATEKTLTGKITHVGSSEIAKNSKVLVQVQDVSLMDAPAETLSSVTITDATTFPISYTLKYDPSKVKAHHRYSMSVRINGPDSKLHFINDVHTSANLEQAAPKVDIAVIRVGGAPAASSSSGKQGDKKACAPVNCKGKTKTCPYGFHKQDGCEICKCSDPCNPPGKPILCGPKQRCFVEKKADGTFGTRCGTTSSSSSSKKNKDSKPLDPKVACNQPKVTGPCRAFLPRFYYNAATKSCESFTFGGCRGNGNNFLSKQLCETTCKAA